MENPIHPDHTLGQEISHELDRVGATLPPAPPGEAGFAPANTTTPLTTRQALTYSSGNLGSGIFVALNVYFLPTLLQTLGVPLIVNNLLSSTHSFEGTFLQPLVGAWSDRTWHARYGRRRIFVMRFVPITVVLLILTPFIPGLFGTPQLATWGVVLVGLSIFFFSIAYNLMFDPYQALLPDITPQAQRGRVNSIFQAVGAFGQVSFLAAGLIIGNITDSPIPLFLIAAVMLLIFFIPTVLGVSEPRELAGLKQTHRYTLRDYWQGLVSDRQVLLYFAVQLLLWLGINAISVNITLYGKNVLGLKGGGALILPLVLLLSTAISYVPFIWLTDRLGLKRIFVFGMVCLSLASLGATLTHDLGLTCALLVLAGVGNAAQTVSSYPLLTRLVFPDQMGLYTGLNTAVTSVSAPASSLIAGGLLTILGFGALFPFLVVMFVLSLIPLALLNVERSRAAQALKQGILVVAGGEHAAE